MATTIVNSVAGQLPGVGVAGVGQPAQAATSEPTVLTVTTVTTAVLTQGILRGKVRCKISTVDSTSSVASITLSVTDSNSAPVTYTIGAFNPASADRVTGQGVEFVQEFCIDPKTAGDTIVSATAKVTGAGSIAGTIAYFIDLEMAGN